MTVETIVVCKLSVSVFNYLILDPKGMHQLVFLYNIFERKAFPLLKKYIIDQVINI